MHGRVFPSLASLLFVVAVVRSLSCVRLFATPWTAACPASLSFTSSQSSLKLMSSSYLGPSHSLCETALAKLKTMIQLHKLSSQWVRIEAFTKKFERTIRRETDFLPKAILMVKTKSTQLSLCCDLVMNTAPCSTPLSSSPLWKEYWVYCNKSNFIMGINLNLY